MLVKKILKKVHKKTNYRNLSTCNSLLPTLLIMNISWAFTSGVRHVIYDSKFDVEAELVEICTVGLHQTCTCSIGKMVIVITELVDPEEPETPSWCLQWFKANSSF